MPSRDRDESKPSEIPPKPAPGNPMTDIDTGSDATEPGDDGLEPDGKEHPQRGTPGGTDRPASDAPDGGDR